jgi:hypothetical protein
MPTKIDPPDGQLLRMTDLEQFAGMQTLDTAADIFEVSPRETFSKAEVVRTLRGLKENLFDGDCVAAYEIAMTDGLPSVLPLSPPS